MVSLRAISNQKNIWVAAGDGDLERVQELVHEGQSPNAHDENGYTPMHAAASYARKEVLDFLISSGGDVNIKDDDGETPLYAVESVEMARYLVERGAIPDVKNESGETPADTFQEESSAISVYLCTISPPVSTLADVIVSTPNPTLVPSSPPSQYIAEQTTERLTTGLMSQIQDIMEQAERDGTDPQEELQRVLGDAFLASAQAGREMSGINSGGPVDRGGETKRARRDPDGPER